MFGKIKKLIALLAEIEALVNSHATEIEALKAEILALKPVKKTKAPAKK